MKIHLLKPVIILFCLAFLCSCISTKEKSDITKQQEVNEIRISLYKESLWMVQGSLMNTTPFTDITDGDIDLLKLMQNTIPGLEDIDIIERETQEGYTQSILALNEKLQTLGGEIVFPSLTPDIFGNYTVKTSGITLLQQQKPAELEQIIEEILETHLETAYTDFEEKVKLYDIYSNAIKQLGRDPLTSLHMTFTSKSKELFKNLYLKQVQNNETQALENLGGKITLQ